MRRVVALLAFCCALVLAVGAPATAQETVIPPSTTPTGEDAAGTGAATETGPIIAGDDDEATPPSTINTATTVAEPEGEEETNERSEVVTAPVVAVDERNAWFWLPLLVALGAGALMLAYAASTMVVGRGRDPHTAA